MILVFDHIGFNDITGAAAAHIPGPVPASGLDRTSYFSIQAGFYIAPKERTQGRAPDAAAAIPGTGSIVCVHFTWELEVPGTDTSLKSHWPEPETYRPLFVRMLANMLQYRADVLPA